MNGVYLIIAIASIGMIAFALWVAIPRRNRQRISGIRSSIATHQLTIEHKGAYALWHNGFDGFSTNFRLQLHILDENDQAIAQATSYAIPWKIKRWKMPGFQGQVATLRSPAAGQYTLQLSHNGHAFLSVRNYELVSHAHAPWIKFLAILAAILGAQGLAWSIIFGLSLI